MRARVLAAGVAAGAVMLAGCAPAPGSVDGSYGGGDGVASFGVGSGGQAGDAVTSSDGKTVVVYYSQNEGQVARRLNADGSVDMSWGGDGTVLVSGCEICFSFGAAVQANGKVLVGVGADSGSGVYRFNVDGTPDTSYGSSGRVAVPGFIDLDLALLPSGGLVTGSLTTVGSVEVRRWTTAGQPEPTFGLGGLVRVDAQGGIVDLLAGSADRVSVVASSPFRVTRLLSNGAQDPSYGPRGSGVIDEGADASVAALAPDGALWLASGSALRRLNPSGTAQSASGSVTGTVAALTVDVSGRPVTAGSAAGGVRVSRLSTSGGADWSTVVSTGGTVTPVTVGALPPGKVTAAGGQGETAVVVRLVA